jgi:tRNA pseudouridine55 synthase
MTGAAVAGGAPSGLLLADKGPGVTSFQVVAHLRRALRIAKIGHGGTLDPMATGVLPLLLGSATRLTAYLQGQDKEYLATVRLGVTTDTLDATGRVTGERSLTALDAVAIRAVLARFEGEIDQIPPMFSALHVKGRRLHELARAGVEVPRAPRRVRVDAIELLEWAPPRLRLRVACGKGTYIRSLAADIGEALGCGAHLEDLCRTRIGLFHLDHAVPWAQIQQGHAASLLAWILPPDRAAEHLPALRIGEDAARRLAHGQVLAPGQVPAEICGPCRLYVDQVFLGIAEAGAGGLRALRLLHADLPRARPVPS